MKKIYQVLLASLMLLVLVSLGIPVAYATDTGNTGSRLRSQVAEQLSEETQQQVQNMVQEAQEQQVIFQTMTQTRSAIIEQKISDILDARLSGETATSPSAILRRTTRVQELVTKMDTVLEAVGKVDGIQNGNLRAQLNIIAQDQLDIQSVIEKKWIEIEKRPRVLKFFLGPDYNSLRDVKNQMTQNELQLNLMTQMRNQTNNEADKQIIQENMQALVQQNTQLQEQVNAEEGTFSLFGWFAKLFAR